MATVAETRINHIVARVTAAPVAAPESLSRQVRDNLPPSNRIVDSKWVFSIKLKVDRSKDKYKIRLVAHDVSQNPEDYGSIMSPVVDTIAIRYTLGHVVLHDLEIAALDVPTAYLSATLHKDVFMCLPDADWSAFGLMGPRLYIKLKKSVSSLKQSGRCWYEDISAFLTRQMGLKQSISAPGLFYSTKLIVNLYIDGLLLVGTYKIVHNTIWQMRECFSAKDNFCGNSFVYIGLAIYRQQTKRQI